MASAPVVLWKAALDEYAGYAAPVVDDLGNVYVTTFEHLYALDAGGALRWKIDTKVPEAGSFGFQGAAIQLDGSVVTSEAQCLVRSFSADGSELFALPLEPTPCVVHSPPTLGADGMIYVTSADYALGIPVLHAISPSGEIAWATPLGEPTSEASAVAMDATGSLFVSLAGFGYVPDNAVVKVGADGQVLWSVPTKLNPRTPAIAPGGSAWVVRLQDVGEDGPNVHVFSPDGAEAAAADLSYSVVADAPAIDAAGNAYLAMAWGLTAIDPSGQPLWMIPSEPAPATVLSFWGHGALDAQGTLVISDATGALRGVRDGAVVFSVEREAQGYGGMADAVAIGPDGTIYAGSQSNFVYAIR